MQEDLPKNDDAGPPPAGDAGEEKRSGSADKVATGTATDRPLRSPRPPQSRRGGKAGLVAGSVVLVIALVIVLLAVTSGRPSKPLGISTTTGAGDSTSTTAAPGDLAPSLARLAAVPVSALDAVGYGGFAASSNEADDPLNPLTSPGSALLPTTNGRPTIFFLGGEYCPYCAAERWSVILALSRFGHFTGLGAMSSSSADVFPDTPTFTFFGASYTSRYVGFSGIEVETRSGASLQAPTPAEVRVVGQWDPQGYVPFLDVANRYIGSLPNWDTPRLFHGLSRTQIAADTWVPTTALGREIDADANYLIAAVCAVDGNRPGSVCGTAGVKAAASQLRLMPPAAPIT